MSFSNHLDPTLSNFQETVKKKAKLKKTRKACEESLADDVENERYLEVLQNQVIPTFETAFACFSTFASEELFARLRKIYQTILQFQGSGFKSEFSSRISPKIDELLPRLKAFYRHLDVGRAKVAALKKKAAHLKVEVRTEKAVAAVEDPTSSHLDAYVNPLKKISEGVSEIRDMVAGVWIDVYSLEEVLQTVMYGDLEEKKGAFTETGSVDLSVSGIVEENAEPIGEGESGKVKA